MKILAVTGLTGKSGTGDAMVKLLAEKHADLEKMFPDRIRIIVRQEIQAELMHSILPFAEIVIGDLTNAEDAVRLFNGVDTILHIAGVHWSKFVVDAAAHCGVRRIIAVHTTGIYSKYKEAGEEYRNIDSYVYDTCRKAEIKLNILRPTMIYGKTTDKNVITFIKMVDKFPIMPVVNGARYELQPVHCTDVAKGCYLALSNEDIQNEQEFILSGAEPILLRDMFKVIGQHLGKKVKFISCPYWIAYPGAWVIYCLSIGKIDAREKVQRLCEPRAFSHDEATRVLGFQPLSFADGVEQEVKEYLKGKNV